MEISSVIQEIQYVLAPAIMVSSSALLLLGFQNKFSNLANRFRALNQEKRLLSQKAERGAGEETRLRNLTVQIGHLMRRAACVKSAIIFAYSGIICFTGTSVLIFLNVHASLQLFMWIIAIFMVGLLFILLSSVLMIIETKLFYRVIAMEHRS